MKKVWLPEKKFIETFEYVPRVAINILIKTPKGIVLTKRNTPPNKGCWHIPGVFLLKGETFEEACKRVAKKEIGVKIKVLKLLGAYETFKDTRGHVVSLNFLCKKVSGNFKPDVKTVEIGIFKNIPRKIFPDQDKYLKEVLE